MSEREREPGLWESIVSQIVEHGRDRDDRQATRSATAASPPSYPSHPPPTPAPVLSLAGLCQLTGKVRWRLPAPSLWVMMRLSVSVSYRTPSKQKSPKKEIDIMHPHFISFFFLFSDDLCVLSHSHCTHSLVVFRQVTSGNMLDFYLVCYCFIASKNT